MESVRDDPDQHVICYYCKMLWNLWTVECDPLLC